MNFDLSIVIAVFNGAGFLEKCLTAVTSAATGRKVEIILIDDCSTDNSGEIGEKFGAQVVRLKTQAGAANARNVGVGRAQGKIILFIDADVVIKVDAINRVENAFRENPTASAIFGSYDDAPSEPNFFSQYRNLMHHFFHQTGKHEAETFWSGFGAIKRRTFLEVGGFDAEKFTIPAIEDIELGYRLRKRGYRVLLVPKMQAKHLKHWTFYSILRTDFWQRAVPWAELILLNPQIDPGLNAQISQKISAVLTATVILSGGMSLWNKSFLVIAFSSLIALIIINKDYYIFFLRNKGFLFTLKVLPMHLFYFFYSSLAFIYSLINVKIFRRTVIVR